MRKQVRGTTRPTRNLRRLFLSAAVLLLLATVLIAPTAAADLCDGKHLAADGWEPWTTGNTPIVDGGKYYLNGEVEITDALTIPSNTEITLCLNGNVLKQKTSSKHVLYLSGNGKILNITDCKDTEHYFTVGSNGLWKLESSKPSSGDYKTLNGGVITGGTRSTGAGIYVHESAVLNLYDGNIVGNSASYDGGGVSVGNSGKFNMYGGNIIGNRAADDGGGVYVYNNVKSTFNMYGGNITENQAGIYGGGVRVESGILNILGEKAIISKNIAGSNGGGVNSAGVFTMEKGTISNNKAEGSTKTTGYGGGVYVYGSSTGSFILKNGIITDNTATNLGGGVYYASGSITISDKPTVKDNKANGVTSNVYLTSGKTITVDATTGLSTEASIGVSYPSPGETGVAVTAACADYSSIIKADAAPKEMTYYNEGAVWLKSLVAKNVEIKVTELTAHMTHQSTSGALKQSEVYGDITPIELRAWNGYFFNKSKYLANEAASGLTFEVKKTDVENDTLIIKGTPSTDYIMTEELAPTEKRTYTVTWYNYDGSQIKTESALFGETLTPPTPTYTPTATGKTYTFNGWAESKEQATGKDTVTVKAGENNYYAAFTTEAVKHTVTWYNYDGTKLEETKVEHGQKPAAPATQPTVPTAAGKTYTFVGWATAKEQATGTQIANLPEVTADTAYYAAYSADTVKYTVTWYNYDGSKLEETKVEHGQKPVAPTTQPTVPTAAGKTYTFVGWATAKEQATGTQIENLPAVTADISYYAAFTTATIKYTVTWYEYDGTEMETAEVIHGQKPTAPTKQPTAPTEAGKTYTFTGWATAKEQATGESLAALPEVTADIAYYAAFAPVTYTVTVAADANSEITGDNPQTVSGEINPITIKANTGYFFNESATYMTGEKNGLTVLVSGASKDTVTITGTLTADVSLTFAVEQIPATVVRYDVAITLGSNMELGSTTLGELTQTGVIGKIDNITINAKSGYVFDTADYANLAGANGLTFDFNADKNVLTISGIPTSDVTLTLPAAEAKTTPPSSSPGSGYSGGSSTWITNTPTPTPDDNSGITGDSIIYKVTTEDGYVGKIIIKEDKETLPPTGTDSYYVAEVSLNPDLAAGEIATIYFKIPLSVLEDKGLGAADARLYYYGENGWTALPTVYTVDGIIVYYEATTTGVNLFAIVFEENGATPKGGNVPTDVPTATDAPKSPGFSILAILAGLGCIALVRRP